MTNKNMLLYQYKAKITKVYDGDTFTFEVDLGFSITIKERLRLYGVNTPEIRLSRKTTPAQKKKGLAVRDYVRGLILGKTVDIKVYKKGKYGRYIAKVSFDNCDLSEHLVSLGMAIHVKY